MSTLPTEFVHLTTVFAPMFSQPVFQSVQVLLAGAILATGKRTVTAVLRVMGLAQEARFQTFHRVLNRARWSMLAVSRRLLFALIDAFLPHGPLAMGLDDTIERRRGARIAAKGIERDPGAPPTTTSSRPAACSGCA
jgi:DDE superfamily endonuclease